MLQIGRFSFRYVIYSIQDLHFYSVSSIKEAHVGHKDTFTPDDGKTLDRFLYPIPITIVWLVYFIFR